MVDRFDLPHPQSAEVGCAEFQVWIAKNQATGIGPERAHEYLRLVSYLDGVPVASAISSRSDATPRPVSTRRSRSRPRRCQMLQRKRGWAWGSHRSVKPSPMGFRSNQREAIRSIRVPLRMR